MNNEKRNLYLVDTIQISHMLCPRLGERKSSHEIFEYIYIYIYIYIL